MKEFPLSNFEAHLNRVIVERGREYMLARRIGDLQEVSPGEFTAVVEGSEQYDVRVSLSTGSMGPVDQLVTDISCSCPYDGGPYCKHVAAVLFVLRERPPAVSGTTDRASRLKSVLARLTREELEEIILSYAGSDQIFALGVLTEYDADPANRVAADLRLSIRSELERFADSWGLIGYRDSFAAAEVFDRLFDHIDSNLARRAFRPAFDVTTAIIEEAAMATTYTDDSAGVMGEVVRRGIEALRTIVEAEIDDDLRHDIVNYVKRTVDSEQFPDVADWGLELWRLSTAAVGSEEEYHHLLSALQEALPPEEPDSGFARDYMREQLLLLMTELMERFGDQEQAESIRLENRHLAEFREALLSRAWSEEEFETVIRLAEEGIARDTHLPGLLKQWRVWALEACRAANRIEEARRTARDLVLAGDPEFLTTYRDLVPSDGWPAAREVRDAILLEFPRRPAMRDELPNAATPRRRDY